MNWIGGHRTRAQSKKNTNAEKNRQFFANQKKSVTAKKYTNANGNGNAPNKNTIGLQLPRRHGSSAAPLASHLASSRVIHAVDVDCTHMPSFRTYQQPFDIAITNPPFAQYENSYRSIPSPHQAATFDQHYDDGEDQRLPNQHICPKKPVEQEYFVPESDQAIRNHYKHSDLAGYQPVPRWDTQEFLPAVGADDENYMPDYMKVPNMQTTDAQEDFRYLGRWSPDYSEPPTFASLNPGARLAVLPKSLNGNYIGTYSIPPSTPRPPVISYGNSMVQPFTLPMPLYMDHVNSYQLATYNGLMQPSTSLLPCIFPLTPKPFRMSPPPPSITKYRKPPPTIRLQESSISPPLKALPSISSPMIMQEKESLEQTYISDRNTTRNITEPLSINDANNGSDELSPLDGIDTDTNKNKCIEDLQSIVALQKEIIGRYQKVVKRIKRGLNASKEFSELENIIAMDSDGEGEIATDTNRHFPTTKLSEIIEPADVSYRMNITEVEDAKQPTLEIEEGNTRKTEISTENRNADAKNHNAERGQEIDDKLSADAGNENEPAKASINPIENSEKIMDSVNESFYCDSKVPSLDEDIVAIAQELKPVSVPVDSILATDSFSSPTVEADKANVSNIENDLNSVPESVLPIPPQSLCFTGNITIEAKNNAEIEIEMEQNRPLKKKGSSNGNNVNKSQIEMPGPVNRVRLIGLSNEEMEILDSFTFPDEINKEVPKQLKTVDNAKDETNWVRPKRLQLQLVSSRIKRPNTMALRHPQLPDRRKVIK